MYSSCAISACEEQKFLLILLLIKGSFRCAFTEIDRHEDARINVPMDDRRIWSRTRTYRFISIRRYSTIRPLIVHMPTCNSTVRLTKWLRGRKVQGMGQHNDGDLAGQEEQTGTVVVMDGAIYMVFDIEYSCH